MDRSASTAQPFPQYRVRQAAQGSQPRYVVAKRLNSVRLNWFMLGSLSGIVLCFVFNLLIGGLLSGGTSLTVDDEQTAMAIEAEGVEDALAYNEEDGAAQEGDLQAKAEEAPRSYPFTLTHKLKSGETLTDILTEQAIDYQHAHEAVSVLRKTFNPRGLQAGQSISMTLDEDADGSIVLSRLEIVKSATESVSLARGDNGRFVASSEKKALKPELTLAGGTIVSSLFETGYENGIPDGVLAELVQAYSYDVDFQREIQRGDQLEVLFEKMVTDEGEAAGHGDIVYAKLNLSGKPLSIYRYEDKSGTAGFFNEKGESIIKALLRTPINGARISSGFGVRKHPILGYSKMHKGTDFAASTGTPIYAAGEGTIAYAGRKGAYGNYVQVKHNGTYATAYAHLSRFASGMRPGKKVRQGQVIGYVGSTGRSTGPHLHFEVLKNGAQVNPMGEKFQTGKVLQGTGLANFKANISKIKQQVASLPRSKTAVASAQ